MFDSLKDKIKEKANEVSETISGASNNESEAVAESGVGSESSPVVGSESSPVVGSDSEPNSTQSSVGSFIDNVKDAVSESVLSARLNKRTSLKQALQSALAARQNQKQALTTFISRLSQVADACATNRYDLSLTLIERLNQTIAEWNEAFNACTASLESYDTTTLSPEQVAFLTSKAKDLTARAEQLDAYINSVATLQDTIEAIEPEDFSVEALNEITERYSYLKQLIETSKPRP